VRGHRSIAATPAKDLLATLVGEPVGLLIRRREGEMKDGPTTVFQFNLV